MSGANPDAARFAPIRASERNKNLDVARGVAVLGTFFVGAVAYGLPHAAFFNLESPGSNGLIDWVFAVFGEIFIDQKAVALLAIVFGAGIVMFADRAKSSGRPPRRSTLWRSFWLFWLGVPIGMHGLLWEGNPLWFFGFFSPLPILLRNRSPRLLVIFGTACVVFSAILAPLFQTGIPDDVELLGQYWVTGAHGTDGIEGAFMYLPTEILFRLLGAIMIGMALARLGIVQGTSGSAVYRRMVAYGFGVGLPLAIAAVVWRAIGDFGPGVAMVAEAPNTLAGIPMALGYLGLVTLWGKRSEGSTMLDRVGAVGQMALTNSIVQTIFGIAVLRDGIIGRGELSRSGIAGVVLAVWVIQLLWSKPWLDRFRFGPFEWLIRSITYRSIQPFRASDG